jgi:hypothetical protein
MSLGRYVLGYVVLIVALAIAYLLLVAPQWIAVSAVYVVGIAILHGVVVTRQRDPAR